MDFKSGFFEVVASFLLVFQRIVLLIISPYKAMRRISHESDVWQIGVIFGFILLYFFIANRFRQFPYEFGFLFLLTFFHYLLSVNFFYLLSRFFHKNITLSSFAFTLAYALIPTLIWFTVNSFLFVLLPPPRTMSVLGKSFSLLYISFSVSMLLWKIILTYLAIRFSSRLNVFKVIYFMILYLMILVPYSGYLYFIGLFRIPFI